MIFAVIVMKFVFFFVTHGPRELLSPVTSLIISFHLSLLLQTCQMIHFRKATAAPVADIISPSFFGHPQHNLLHQSVIVHSANMPEQL